MKLQLNKIVFLMIILITALVLPSNFLWKVECSEGSAKIYLLGSVHIVPDSVYPLSDVIEDAFERSDYLVVEADMKNLDIAKTQMLMMQKGLYTDGRNLRSVLSEETYKKLEKAVEEIGMIPMMQLNMMKPWLVSLTLPQLMIVDQGLDPEKGIDMHFLSKAKNAEMEILELESADFQMELLSGFDEKTQIAMLENTLEELPEFKEKFEKMVAAWSSGDIDKMEEIIEKEHGGKKELGVFYDKLITERNHSMTEKVISYLESKDGKTYFVVAGSGHMVGKTGIVNQLKEKGYKITRL